MKKRISVFLVVTMLVSILCSFGLVSAETTSEPTQAVATEAPATEAPATEVPVEVPSAIVKNPRAEDMDPEIPLTYALEFIAGEATDDQKAAYGNWYADFVLTVNKDVTFNADGTANGYLAGSYDEWCNGAWEKVPNTEVVMEPSSEVKIMELAAQMLGQPGLKITYREVLEVVRSFRCGVYFTEEFLASNSDLVVTLELRIYNPSDAEDYITIGDVHEFKKTKVEDAETGVTVEGSQLAENTVKIDNVVIPTSAPEASAPPTVTTVKIDTTTIVGNQTDVVDTVTIPVAAVEAADTVLDADGALEIVLANGAEEATTVTIDKEALTAIQTAAAAANGGAGATNITLKVEEAETLEPGQQTTVENKENSVVYEITFVADDGVTEVFNETVAAGSIVVTIPYTPVTTGKVVVKHLTDGGALEDVNATYSNGVITLTLEHFSEYIVYEEEEPLISNNGFLATTTTNYTVKFDVDGGSKVSSQNVSKNANVKEPAAPVKEGYTFAGWYVDEELTEAYDFSAAVTKGFTLYAKWVEGAVEPGEEEPGEEEPGEELTSELFSDVLVNSWFYEDVKFVTENGLMNGITEDEFAPDALLTRAMLVTILYRNEGEPATNRSIPFADVDMGAYYQNAVIWAQQNGIVNGVTETEFAPDALITREQIAAIMFRYAQNKGLEAVTLEENLGFDDADEISEYAISAMNWAVGTGLLNGKTESTLNSQDNASRAEIAAILHRFIAE